MIRKTKIHTLSRLASAIVMLLSFATTFSTHSQVNTDQVIRVGQNAMYFEDYVLAIQYFNQAVQSKPHLAQPYLFRAIAKLNLEDYDGAIKDATTAVKLNPFIPDAWEVRGVANQNTGKHEDAISDYDHALELLPRNRQILGNKAMAQIDAKQYNAADSTYAELLRYHPGYENAYIGHARLKLLTGDTATARADIDRALSINKKSFNAYVMRADIAINSSRDFKQALDDMNEAIKLQPRFAGLYINRAFLRYNLDDYFGAMADYDYAIDLEPLNAMAIFNRGLLLSEVSDNDHALNDFTTVLELNPDDYRALYNRALTYRNKHMWTEAIDDITRVIDAFPDLFSAYYLRSELYRERGNLKLAAKDYDRARALARAARPQPADDGVNPAENGNIASNTDNNTHGDTSDPMVSRRFASLLTTSNNTRTDEEYNNNSIRGRVQDRDIAIEPEPFMELSLYSAPTQLRQGTYYIKEINDLNASRTLRYAIVVTNHPPMLYDEDMIKSHFDNIEYYNSYLSTHTPRAVDYIGRAMDFITLRNYTDALNDIDRAIALSPDFAPAYMLRAQANYRKTVTPEIDVTNPIIDRSPMMVNAEMQEIIADIDKAIKLSETPNPIAWYNKGVVFIDMNDYTSAISSFSHAIDIKPDMGEAYYNRGYLYLKLGNRDRGIADLSKAGELGIVPAYNLLKRMTR